MTFPYDIALTICTYTKCENLIIEFSCTHNIFYPKNLISIRIHTSLLSTQDTKYQAIYDTYLYNRPRICTGVVTHSFQILDVDLSFPKFIRNKEELNTTFTMSVVREIHYNRTEPVTCSDRITHSANTLYCDL